MTDYQKLTLFKAIRRILTDVPPTRKAAVLVSDWMEDADPEFEWAPDRPHRARSVSRQEWGLLAERVEAYVNSLSDARLDQCGRVLKNLGDMVGLNAVEVAILRLAFSSDERRGCGGLYDLLVDDVRMEQFKALSLITGYPKDQVHDALEQTGRLYSAGLIEHCGWSSNGRVGLDVPRQIVRLVQSGHTSCEKLQAVLFPAGPKPTTQWEDFRHLGDIRDLCKRLLEGARTKGQSGVNILFYGPPGTGKTEFCKVLAQELGQSLHAVGEADENGDPPSARERLCALKLAQRLLAGAGDQILLFDEMEDILEGDFFAALTQRRTGRSKVHLHRMLESNTIPTLWTTNDIAGCEPALLRRMTLAVEMRAPGPRVRERIWRQLAARKKLTVDDHHIKAFAREIEVPPALISGALDVAELTNGGEKDLRLAVTHADKALRGGRAKPLNPQTGSPFDPDLIVCDIDARNLLKRLADPGAPRNVSFCFSGAPGTGKSQFARHIADVMGLGVVQKRASDLLSKYVGETESKIAQAFEEARAEEAFLIFDEADSLLGNRADARHSWEVSQVNEMLTWMENHPLPFACTTNLSDRLDPATRRRFTVHAELQALGPQELAIAFRKLFSTEPPPALCDIRGLTVGDMVCVARRCKLMGDFESGAVLDALLDEVAAKGTGGMRPGFV